MQFFQARSYLGVATLAGRLVQHARFHDPILNAIFEMFHRLIVRPVLLEFSTYLNSHRDAKYKLPSIIVDSTTIESEEE
jgi:hypothetical protein